MANLVRAAELAPLLVLCEDEPTVETLFEERDLIRALDVSTERRAELMGLALTVAARHFDTRVLQDLFRQEFEMIRETSIVDEWIQQAAQEARERALTEGEERGLERGRAQGAQALLERQLRSKFGSLPEVTERKLHAVGEAECLDLADRVLTAGSLAELGLE